jgi:hypothetical protein
MGVKRMFGHLKNWLVLRKFMGADKQTIFSHHYKTNFWGDQESRSGPGSTLAYTENLRQELPTLLDELGVKVFLDAPCGDFNWMKEVEMPGTRYIGCDIVPEMIAELNIKYGREFREFNILDIVSGPIPHADLWLCRDVLFHLSNDDVLQTLQNFVNSNIPWILTSTHPDGENKRDIQSGGFRLLNLESAPFNLPMAERYINDSVAGYPARCLGLWHRDTLKQWSSMHPEFK